jgi:DNA invertase Pin-like site-specific DNA recombinase
LTYAYVYIRFSSPKQEKGDSKERQLSDALALCERHGWTVVEPIIEDLGVSAWKGDNLNGGNLGRFAQQVFSGEIEPGSVLVVENLDRISREEPRKAQRWIEDITDTGLRIATVHGNKIYDRDSLRSESSIGEIFEIILAAKLAKKHSDTISSRVKGAWVRRREAASNGKVISAKLPGWLQIVGAGDQRQIQPIVNRRAIGTPYRRRKGTP